MKKFFDKCMSSGIWIQPLTMIGLVIFFQETDPKFLAEQGNWLFCLLVSFLPVLLIWAGTLGRPREEDAMTWRFPRACFRPIGQEKVWICPFFYLSEKSDTQQILEVMQNITYSLISMPAGMKDPFWKESARNLLLGLLIFYYKQGVVDFVGIIDEILGKPAKDSIQAVMEDARQDSVEYRYIVQFSGLEDVTLGGIVAEMNNHIVIFANDQDIRYAFRDNPCKVNPRNLEEGYSIYLSIREEKLSAYYDVMLGIKRSRGMSRIWQI